MEALRELGRDISTEAKVQIKQIVNTDLPESLGMAHASGTLQPNERVSIPQQASENKSKTDHEAHQRLMQMREEEQARARRNEQELKEQIKAIQAEIKSLAKAAGEFANEIEIATMQATVNPGVYHKNFFSRLKSTIALLRKRVAESKHWLAEFNTRSKKRNYYWSQVKKSGTSYMLSSARYAVTSTG